MSLQRIFLLLWTILTGFVISIYAQSGPSGSPPKVIDINVRFPSPVQWSLNSGNSNADVSLTGLAWGPSSAPELIAKTKGQQLNGKPEDFSERPYVIALGFQARIPKPFLNMMTRSGLVLIKDADGSMEPPWALTSSGLVRNDYDLHFAVGDTTIQYWDFFPVTPNQREFLFEVHSPAESVLYFTVTLNNNELLVVNSTPDGQATCREFDKTFGGSIGSDTVVLLEIHRKNTILSGTEQYAKMDKTLWLTGVVDSLGYFTLEERYPKDHVAGILKGRFGSGYQGMSGYFSMPDGSRLRHFEFHEIQQLGTGQNVPSQRECGATQHVEESNSD